MINKEGKLVDLDDNQIAIWSICRLGDILHGECVTSIDVRHATSSSGKEGYNVSITMVTTKQNSISCSCNSILSGEELFSEKEAEKVASILNTVRKLYTKIRDDGYRLLYSEDLNVNKVSS